MKKVLLMLGICAAAFAADGGDLTKKCTPCHGIGFEKSALGKSEVVKGKKAEDIRTSLKEYKAGTLNKTGMGGLMKGQVAPLTEPEIETISKYIAGLK